ncbi:MAG: bifunctional nuclease family protein [Candidatus Aenigmarchaeota archaeon]|nr:bifunctional nuclease family protein [Candidatus Aenigmarchaeota archaeon]
MAKNSIFLYLAVALLIIIVILVSLLLYLATSKSIDVIRQQDNVEYAEWKVPPGYIKPDSFEVTGASVLIKKGCRQLTAETTPERALGIFNALYNRTDQRPDIYEGMVSLMQAYNIKVESVMVYAFADDTFYSDAYFRVGNDILQLDMKPSDAMAVALRTNSSIYFNTTLFNEKSENVC